MTVKFNSDKSYVYQGFTAEYEAFVPTNRKNSALYLDFIKGLLPWFECCNLITHILATFLKRTISF